ncbi:hypothetical protein [Nannocystis pusilla]|uniref:hypothetical protein n=1 Tax=Nannocystis pusilla TaxID=889268 RepID=UPI003DA67765
MALDQRALLDAVDRADDDLERDPQPEVERVELLPRRDRGERPPRGLGHRVAEGPHALAVEGRQQQLALASVRLAGHQEQRVLAEQRDQSGGAEGVEQLERPGWRRSRGRAADRRSGPICRAPAGA